MHSLPLLNWKIHTEVVIFLPFLKSISCVTCVLLVYLLYLGISNYKIMKVTTKTTIVVEATADELDRRDADMLNAIYKAIGNNLEAHVLIDGMDLGKIAKNIQDEFYSSHNYIVASFDLGQNTTLLFTVAPEDLETLENKD